MSDQLANNNHTHQKLAQPPAPPQPAPIIDSFFIDSINENNFQQTNMLFIRDPHAFAEDTSSQQVEQQSKQTSNRMKNWKSESNLLGTNQRAAAAGQADAFNKSCDEKFDNFNPEEDEEEEEYDDYENYDYYVDGMNGEETSLEDEVNNIGPLQFSDHAGLYDPYEVQDENLMNQSDYLNESKRRIILDNFDVYTKKNYKLTYDRSQQQINPHQKQGHKVNDSVAVNQKSKVTSNSHALRNNQNTDSLLSSAIMQQSSNLDGSNYLDEDEEEEEEEDEDQECDPDEYVRLILKSLITC